MTSLPSLADPERQLALTYAPRRARAGLHALWAVDEQFGRVLASTREAGIGAMRLAWWREALTTLDTSEPPAQPLLQALARQVLPLGIAGADLAAMEDGWYALLEADPPGEAEIVRHAVERGGRLFALSARVLGRPELTVDEVGRRWACADLVRRLSDAGAKATARRMAGVSDKRRLPHQLRPLSALSIVAEEDLVGRGRGSPRQVLRLAWHGLTGL
ncbi:squalene/phytoene synthase family protein [Sphingomonas sp. ID0503]|uniref:squalene/phytoene synthase family protein n=1 Tax=Sphingomonas sp. ID0503 TaxID=3399691 RepID=UPI003AFB6B56